MIINVNEKAQITLTEYGAEIFNASYSCLPASYNFRQRKAGDVHLWTGYVLRKSTPACV